ncbi:ribosomal protein L16 [Paenibacillus xylanexedens]|uniref:ribosomal protein L16 n=1 Tax=Paenibacillus xylanexedens TaxID=528191 RepID=UPI0034D96F10
MKIFPHKPITQNPLHVRMPTPKPNLQKSLPLLKPPNIIFQLPPLPHQIPPQPIPLPPHKLPIKTKFVKREQFRAEANQS